MTEYIDARGLSCPQPIFLTQEMIWKVKKGVIEIMVDDPTAKQNITRTAEREGWSVDIREQDDDEYLIILTRN